MIDPDKDVDGLTPVSAGRLALGVEGLRPCTPQGVMTLLDAAGAQLEGAEAVVVGRSNLFGKPMAQLLLGANATVTIVPLAHARPRRGLPPRGRPHRRGRAAPRMVKADWVKPGAIVIDVGMNRTDGRPVRATSTSTAVKEVAARDHAGARRRRTDDDRVPAAQHAAGRADGSRAGLSGGSSAGCAAASCSRAPAPRRPARGDVRRLVRRRARRGRRWRSRASRSSRSCCARWRSLVLTVSRTVAMATSAATITIAVGAIALLLVLYRVVVNEPGTNADGDRSTGGAYARAGARRRRHGRGVSRARRRAHARDASLRQTERVLAVRGAPARAAAGPRPGSPAARGSIESRVT